MKKQIVAAVITDTHMKPANIELVKSVFEELLQFCVANNVETVFHIGDFFTDRSGQNLDCMLAMLLIIKKFARQNINIHAIPGNHCKPSLDKKVSYLHMYEDLDNFFLYDKGISLSLDNYNRIHYLPFFRDPEILQGHLTNLIIEAKAEKKKKNILLAHIAINGVRNNDGTIVDGSNTVEMFKDFDIVLCGHYHDAQKIADNIFYIGSAYQGNFGETWKDKGFTVLYNDMSTELVPTTFPKYKKTVLDASNPVLANKKLEAFNRNKEAGIVENVRFIFKGSQEEIDNLDITRFKEAGVDVRKENIEMAVLFDDVSEVDFVVLDKKNFIKGWMEYTEKIGMENKKKTKGLKMLNKITD